MAERASKSFYAVAKDKKAGDELKDAIKRARGRNGARIVPTTVQRWVADGLVKVVYRPLTKKDHHRAKPIASVVLTKKGHQLIEHAKTWR